MAKKSSPIRPTDYNNPRNNAGPKNSASSRPALYKSGAAKNSVRAGQNAAKRTMAITGRGESALRSYSTAKAGMDSKNVARAKTVAAKPSKIGWAKASGPKAGGASGMGTASRPGGAAVKWGTAGAKRAAPAMVGGFAKGLARAALNGLGRVSAVATAGQAGYMVGSALNNKYNISGRIVDKFAPKYNPNAKTPAKKRK